MNAIKIITIMNRINSAKVKSAWSRGVQLYAMEILRQISEEGHDEFVFDENGKLNLSSWTLYSLSQGFDHWVGLSRAGEYLIYDRDIAIRLCTGSELEKTCWGEKNPSRREDWLDCQGRALFQARNMIVEALKAEKTA